MTKNIPLDGAIIPSQGADVKAQDIIAEVAEHKRLAADIQSALATYYRRAGEPKKADKIADCGKYLELRQYADPDNTATLHRGSWCMHSLCPMCAWRKHLRMGAVLDAAISGMDNLYLLTLTADNTQGLTRVQVMDMIAASTTMIRKVLQIDTYAANIEITERGRGYHPHIHAIVQQPYWSRWSISRSMADWRRKWGQLMGGKHGYNLLDIRQLTDSGGAVAEVTKYISKMSVDTDIERAVGVLAPALRGIRQLRTAGEIKTRIATAKIDLATEQIQERIRLLGYDYNTMMMCWLGGGYKEMAEHNGAGEHGRAVQIAYQRLRMLRIQQPGVYRALYAD